MNGTTRRNGKTWQFIYDAPRRPGAKRKQRTKSGFPTQRAAQRALRAAIIATEAASAEARSHPSPILADWLANTWLPSRGGLRKSTVVSYSGYIRNHVAPDPIGGMALRQITPDDLDEFFIRLAFKPGKTAGESLSGKTRKNIYRFLKTVFDLAVKRDLRPSNPLDSVEEPRPGKPEVLVWNPHETQQFLEAALQDSPRLEPLYLLALNTGLRRGEIAGLQWRHIDFDAQKLRVEQSLIYAGGDVYLQKPKTLASVRTIRLNSASLAALRQAQAIQRADHAAAGEDWTDTRYVFTKPNGEPLHPDYVTRTFRRDAKRAGVRHVRFHGLRHTFATNALALGRNPKAVSEILGHTHVQTTLALYSQHLPGVHDSIIDAVEIGRSKQRSEPDVTIPVITSADSRPVPTSKTGETPASARVSEFDESEL